MGVDVKHLSSPYVFICEKVTTVPARHVEKTLKGWETTAATLFSTGGARNEQNLAHALPL